MRAQTQVARKGGIAESEQEQARTAQHAGPPGGKHGHGIQGT